MRASVLAVFALVGAVDTDAIDDGGGCNGGRTIPVSLTEPETTSTGEPASDEPCDGEACDERGAVDERAMPGAPATMRPRREP